MLLRGTQETMEINDKSEGDQMTMMRESLLSNKSSRKQSSTNSTGRRRRERILKLGLKSLKTSLIYNTSPRSQKQRLQFSNYGALQNYGGNPTCRLVPTQDQCCGLNFDYKWRKGIARHTSTWRKRWSFITSSRWRKTSKT